MAPQLLHVLLCVECTSYQVHIVKKVKKWECKVCGTKQSLQQVFATGTGAECRIIVQKLNEARGELENNRNLQEPAIRQEQESKVETTASQPSNNSNSGGWGVYLE